MDLIVLHSPRIFQRSSVHKRSLIQLHFLTGLLSMAKDGCRLEFFIKEQNQSDFVDIIGRQFDHTLLDALAQFSCYRCWRSPRYFGLDRRLLKYRFQTEKLVVDLHVNIKFISIHFLCCQTLDNTSFLVID